MHRLEVLKSEDTECYSIYSSAHQSIEFDFELADDLEVFLLLYLPKLPFEDKLREFEL